MLKVKIDRQEPTELFEQVAAEIRRAIADGEAKPGERLPPARDLAAVLGVNTNTVLRELREEALLELRRDTDRRSGWCRGVSAWLNPIPHQRVAGCGEDGIDA